MYEALQAQGIQPNTYLLNAMLNVFAECGNAARAQDLYVQMTGMPGYVPRQHGARPLCAHAAISFRMMPDAFTYVALLKAGQRSGKHTVADVDHVMREMAARRTLCSRNEATNHLCVHPSNQT